MCTIKLKYDVSKERGGRYYAHPSGTPGEPVRGSFGEKRHAIKCAARLCGLTPQEYTKIRRSSDNEH